MRCCGRADAGKRGVGDLRDKAPAHDRGNLNILGRRQDGREVNAVLVLREDTIRLVVEEQRADAIDNRREHRWRICGVLVFPAPREKNLASARAASSVNGRRLTALVLALDGFLDLRTIPSAGCWSGERWTKSCRVARFTFRCCRVRQGVRRGGLCR